MSRKIELTAIIEKEGNLYVSFCPELDIASQGKSPIMAKKIWLKLSNFFMKLPQKLRFPKDLNMKYKFELAL